MNIFKFEFKTYLKSTLIWTTSLLLVLLLFLSLFPTYSKNAAQMDLIFKHFPEQFMKAFGISGTSFSTLPGYYSFTFIYILLIGGIFSAKLGLDIFSKELREKVGDFLFIKPVKRITLFTAKLGAALLSIVIMNAAFLPISLLLGKAFAQNQLDWSLMVKLNLTLIFTQLFFLFFSTMIGCIFNKIRSVNPPALGIVFGAYVVYLLNQMLDDSFISYLTPFGHFDINKLSKLGSYSNTHLAFSALLCVLFLGISFTVYRKKEIPSV